MKESALYVHIPFCDHKCIYCDFYSIVTKDNVANYLGAITKEIINYSNEFQKGRNFTSIFFGGGTPSLMEPDYLGDLISCLKNYYPVSDDAEITLETNPGTVDKSKLKKIKEVGFNRISIGVQSFNDDELKFLTRIHDRQLALTTINDASEVGFENISIDLIFNIPGQTKDMWLRNLETAVSLPIKHISAYSLILEKGTILNKMVLDGKVELQDSDYEGEIYHLTMDYLNKKGFIQYEVSNYAKTGYECRHNNSYWHYKDYLSFGTSAHSFINGKRWWNFSSLKHYLLSIDEKGKAMANSEILTEEQMLSEYVMLALRSDGLNLNGLKEKFGDKWLNESMTNIKSLERKGLLHIKKDMITLTQKGYALCDKILEKIL
ncbi:MAG: radical SAM family heme chaperone HemW [Ignavibacteriales bacterium]|nr:radical SAM family heme chaperone HemW [Ignavibacteriales bacterium]